MTETRHHLRSVSDLYAADEIEVLLLEEIRDLEPPPSAYSKPEDIQDFEIGSRTGGRISSQSSELDSPGVHSTVHSWDSHANYHGHYGHGDRRHGSSANVLPWPGGTHLVLYCDVQGHLRTTPGFVRLLLLITSVACLATLCSSGTAKVSLFMLPLVGRLRFMIFVAVFCLLVTTLLLFLDISHIVYMFPFNWTKLNVWVFSGIGLSYVTGSVLLVFSIWEYYASGWVPRRTRSQLTAAAGLGLSCALLAFLLTWIHGRHGDVCKDPSSDDHIPNQIYKPVTNSSSSGITLKERSPKQSWAVRNQQNTKRIGGGDTSSVSHLTTGNGKANQRKKDHWASARQHFLSHDDEDEDEDGIVNSPMQRDESNDLEHKRGRRRRDGGDSLSGGNGVNNSKAPGSTASGDNNQLRRVPRKLPLRTIERPQQNRGAESISSGNDRRSSASKNATKIAHLQSTANNDLQMYWENAVRSVTASQALSRRENAKATANGLPWELVARGNNERDESADVKILQAAVWSGQWQAPDDVQPCSSKTADPYTFA
ncbi:uncharacterized protein [Venturia canescens]|uniref:uncharacterized protein isoform X2 n=1 Tax=Venturia canescens TaxID=32260 RepID=UPI001C9C4477|nr:uncharacterized protein LOC122419188 isoform X2 [Venturia canescens]